jgi:hypothetical protein
VGKPAPAPLVAAYFTAALCCWAAAAAALIGAASPLAAGELGSPRVLLAVHLLTIGFLPFVVTGGTLHILPVLLRNGGSRWRGRLALPLLCAGPPLAYAIAFDVRPLISATAPIESIGFVLVAWELLALVARAPRGRQLLASRLGISLSVLHAAAALAFGALLASADASIPFGLTYRQAVAIHLHLAVVGWLTLLLVTVGRTLGPMLALAPAEPPRRAPVEELTLTAGLWLLLIGIGTGSDALRLAGGLVVLAAMARFAVLMLRVARGHRLELPEGPLLHFATGLLFLGQGAVLGVVSVLDPQSNGRRIEAYVAAILLGWAAGATLGHVGKLLSLSAWMAWPPGPRPKQDELYPRRLWLVEAALFAVAAETVIDGILAGSSTVVAAGGVLALLAAAAALVGAGWTLRKSLPALGTDGVFARV